MTWGFEMSPQIDADLADNIKTILVLDGQLQSYEPYQYGGACDTIEDLLMVVERLEKELKYVKSIAYAQREMQQKLSIIHSPETEWMHISCGCKTDGVNWKVCSAHMKQPQSDGN